MRELEWVPGAFSVCRLASAEQADLSREFTFFAKTDEEISLVCETDAVPPGAAVAEHGWRMLRVKGELDFGLVGILAEIARALAEGGISLFVVSTYRTDYILVKEKDCAKALLQLRAAGYFLQEPG